jgi:hypothetical protein
MKHDRFLLILGIFGRIMGTQCVHCKFLLNVHLVHISIGIKALALYSGGPVAWIFGTGV